MRYIKKLKEFFLTIKAKNFGLPEEVARKISGFYHKHKILTSLIALLLVIFLVFASYFLYLCIKTPKLDIEHFQYSQNAEILDKNGKHYQSFQGEEVRQIVKISDLPEHVTKAFIDIEDERFYKHHGVDMKGLTRAVLGVVTSGNLDGVGGSTITQQLIKLTHLTSERSIERKFQEMRLARKLEKKWDKEQILESYLNKINLGGVYGIEAASHRYFNKSAKDLTPAQSAILAAIPKSPVYYHPYTFNDKDEIVKKNGKPVLSEDNQYRAGLVLDKMKDLGDLTDEEYDKAQKDLGKGAGLTVVNLTPTYSYFTDALYSQLIDDLMEQYEYSYEEADELIQSGGLKVHSTVDPKIQKTLEEISQDDDIYPWQSYSAQLASEATGKEYIPQSAATIVNNKTGAVVAMEGGRGEKFNLGMNRATSSFPTGSSTKPLTAYGPALNEGKITLASVFNDTDINWGSWNPKNSSGGYKGPVSIRTGLSESINTIATQVVAETGIDTCADYAEKLGLTVDPEDKEGGASLALGGYHTGQSTLQMAGAFSTFPRGGEYIRPYLYTKVEDREGKIILENKTETERVYTKDTSYLITSVLKDVVSGGTTNVSVDGCEVAGKTGTTDEERHAWFCGYTPNYSMAVWYGYDENIVEVNGETYYLNIDIFGGSKPGPALLFERVMNNIKQKEESFSKPSTILQSNVDSISGKMPSAATGSEQRSELFAKDTVPKLKDDVHVTVETCRETGKKKGANCTDIEKKTYLDLSKLKKVSGITYNGGFGALESRKLPKLETCTDSHKPKETEINLSDFGDVTLTVGETHSIPITTDSTPNIIVNSNIVDVSYSVNSINIGAIKAGETTITVVIGGKRIPVRVTIEDNAVEIPIDSEEGEEET